MWRQVMYAVIIGGLIAGLISIWNWKVRSVELRHHYQVEQFNH